MARGSVRAHRFSIICAAVAVVCLGWAPSQAFAADGVAHATVLSTTDPLDSVTSTIIAPVDTVTNAVTQTAPSPVDTVTNTVSNTAPSPVDTVTNTVSNTVAHTPPSPVDTVTNTVSQTAPSPVDTVTNTVSGTVDTVSNTTTGTVSTTGSGTVDTVSGKAFGTASGTLGHATAAAGTEQQTAATGRPELLRPLSRDDLVLLAQRTQAESSIGDQGHATCVAGVGASCQTVEGSGGSWTRSVADIIRKLVALTGMSAMTWFVVACLLTLAGMVALYQSRDRSGFRSARSS
jgi:phage-related protein